MGEIDNLEYTEDDGKPERGQSVDGSHKDAVNQVFYNEPHENLPIWAGCTQRVTQPWWLCDPLPS